MKKGQLLVRSAGNGDTAQTAALLREGANVNGTGRAALTPLVAALGEGRIETAKFLVEQGADVNMSTRYGITPLEAACFTVCYLDDLDIVRYLLEHGADINLKGGGGSPPLIAAVSQNNPDLVRLLLDAGIDVNQYGVSGHCFSMIWTTALTLSLWHKYTEVAQILLEAGACVSIEDAVMLGKEETVAALLQQETDVNDVGSHLHFLLELAISHGHPNIARLLIAQGANTEGRVLHMAAIFDQPEIIAMLLDAGLDINADYFGSRPLEQAVFSGSFQAVRILVERGVDISHSTALINAVIEDNVDMVRYLLEHGADVNARDAQGRTALARVKNDNDAMRELLKQFGVPE